MRNVHLVPPQDRLLDPWGYPSEKQGQRHHDKAVRFIAEHPIGTELTRQELRDIGQELFPEEWEKYGGLDAHVIAGLLRESGNHPRMGEAVFDVYLDRSSGNYFVIGMREAIDNAEPFSKVLRSMVNEVRKLNQKLRGAQLSDEEKHLIKPAYQEIGHLQLTLQRMVFDEQLKLADAVNGQHNLSANNQPQLKGAKK
jgi:hypothetical protein